jgi:hypothetical protein
MVSKLNYVKTAKPTIFLPLKPTYRDLQEISRTDWIFFNHIEYEE